MKSDGQGTTLLTKRTSLGKRRSVANRRTGLSIGCAKEEFVQLVNSVVPSTPHKRLTTLCGFARREDFQQAHRRWVEEALVGGPMMQDDRWSEAIAVGSFSFVEKVKSVG